MKKSKVLKVIERIAAQEGASTDEVRDEMQKAINLAFKNRDNSMKDFWDKWNGSCPTVEEFINAASKSVFDKIF